LGVGSGFRVPIAAETEVPHHPFAVWRTTDVRDHGGFRGELTRNQDDEFSMRARSRGARIFALPEATVRYRPRERLRGLAVQYFQYGLWKAAVGRTEGLFPLRSLAPAGVTVAGAVALGVAAGGRSRVPLALGALVYGGAGVVIARARPRARLGWTAAALATTHLAYGAGLLTGVTRPGLVRSRRAAVQGRDR
jgi:succinoglycan biosynthesis protein ExoA